MSAPPASLPDALRRRYLLERKLGRLGTHAQRTGPRPAFPDPALAALPALPAVEPRTPSWTDESAPPLPPIEAQVAEVI